MFREVTRYRTIGSLLLNSQAVTHQAGMTVIFSAGYLREQRASLWDPKWAQLYDDRSGHFRVRRCSTVEQTVNIEASFPCFYSHSGFAMLWQVAIKILDGSFRCFTRR
jgi:hypothetical protein